MTDIEKRDDELFENASSSRQDTYGVKDAAIDGQPATDSSGQALVTIDEQAEKRLRRKMDLYLIPVVFMLYLWTFIDRYLTRT